MTTIPPTKPAAPRAPVLPTRPAGPPPAAARGPVQFGAIPAAAGHRVVLYGPGGIGKTSLACYAPGPVAMLDLDESLPRLRSQLEASGILGSIRTLPATHDWAALRAMLQAPGWDSIKTVVIDTGTKAQELAEAWTLSYVPHEKGNRVTRLEDYGYGKGYQHVYETFLGMLGDLDAHARAGRNVIIVTHDCTATVPNPAGEDWLRYEPRLQTSNGGKASIRLRVKEWADHVLFFAYDVDVSKDGKGRGAGTRTLYTAELPFCLAKSRTVRDQYPVTEDNRAEVWAQIIA